MHRTVRLAGTGSFLPPCVIDNEALFRMPSIRDNFDVERARGALGKDENQDDPALLSSDEVFDRWARQVTGIRERRTIDPDGSFTTEDMSVEAARGALAMAGMEIGDIDLIIVATVTPSDAVPNAACTVANLLGAPQIGGFTLNGACAGYIHAVSTGFALIQSGVARTVLVIAADALTRVTDYADPKTAVLFSDGAGASILTVAEDGEQGRFLGVPYLAGDYAREHLYMLGHGWADPDEPTPKLHMGGGPRVLRRAILAMAGAAEHALRSAEMEWDDVDWVVPHQANLRITKGLEKHLALSRGRVVHTIESYGNSSASTAGIALDELLRGRHGVVPDPARIILTAVGGGYTMGAVAFEWRGGAR